MAMITIVCAVIATVLGLSNAWLVLDRPEVADNVFQSNRGTPLILTPFLESERIQDARDTARVEPFVGNITSYSGLFTVDKRYNSTMFFWYFPAESNTKSAPVVLWLQGGPGGSSLYGLFLENGPYSLSNNGSTINLRDVYWSKTMHVIYIDNPVGTGFSFTDSTAGYSRDETSVGKNLYQCLIQFFTMFPELRNNNFFVTGESYAGKYVPAISYTIHKNNPYSKVKINLKGLAIGNGLVDPINQLNYGDYYYQIGIIDENQKKLFKKAECKAALLISRKSWVSAYQAFGYIQSILFSITTGFQYPYNYLISENIDFSSATDNFLNNKTVRRALHVDNVQFNSIDETSNVRAYLERDWAPSIAPWLTTLANNYRVLIYNGQLDCILPYVGAENYAKKLRWCGANQFKSAKRMKWYVNDTLAGYIKTSAPSKCKGSLSLSLVRNAGHMVPQDQAVWAYDLISRLTSNSLQ